MKKILLLFAVILITGATYGQLTGVKSIGGGGDYATLVLAIADLNSQGVGAGGVTFNVPAGYTETIAAPLSVTATGTSANPIIFRKDGTGVNPLITAYVGTATPGSAVQDGIWNLVGSDYVTIDGIDLFDPNTTNPATMEYGYALFKASATDGCQYNTIKNCTVSLSRNNNAGGSGPSQEGSRAINVANALVTAQTTNVTVTAAGGSNSYNMFYTNLLQQCNYGIALAGFAASSPFTYGDTGNDVGGSSALTGNTILNYGGAASTSNPAAGIRATNQWGINISYNTINSNNGSGANHPNTLRGIYAQSGTSANATISYNTVTIHGGALTSQLSAIENGIGSTAASNTININNNTVTNCTYSTATTGIFYGVYNSSSAATVNLNGNTVSNITHSGTGWFYGIETGSPTAASLNNNTVTGIVRTGASGSTAALKLTSPASLIGSGNLADGLSYSSGTSTGSIYGLYGLSSAVNITLSNNIFRNFSTPTTGTLCGIREYGNSGIKVFENNQVYNFSTTTGGAGGATMYGIWASTGDITSTGNTIYALNSTGTTGGSSGTVAGIYYSGGTTNACSKNKIYTLSSNSTNPLVCGIYLGSGTTNTIFNNYIGDLGAPYANAGIPLSGLQITGGTNANVYYNTVYLNALSSGALFGSSAIYASTSVNLTLRNNILVNTSVPNGANGYTVAYRRSGTTLSSYQAASNNNLFFAGLPGPNYLIHYDGTNPFQTLAAYQAMTVPATLAPRDNVSITENPSFLSTTGADANFLHISTSISTGIESGGAIIAGINDDYDGNIRFGSTGYTGGGAAPDIGADEFEGIPSYTCNVPSPGNTIASVNNICLGTTVNFSLEFSTSGTGVAYQWQSSEDGITYADIPGANQATYSVVPTAPLYYQCNVTCNKFPPTTTASSPVQITFANSVLISTPNTRCGTGTVDLFAMVSSGTPTWYDAATGGNNLGTGSPFTTPVISSTTTFYVADVTSAPSNVTLGAGALTSSGNSGYQTPFNYYYGGEKSQYLIRASDLIAAGLGAGNITAIALDVASSGATLNGFTLSAGTTALNALTNTFQTGLSPVYTAASITPTAGIFTITFDVPYNWDGSSNLILDFCWSNANYGGSPSAHVKYDNTAYVATTYARADGMAPAIMCGYSSGYGTYSTRPKMILSGTAACSSPRVAVVATVLDPPPITASATPDAWCEGASSVLNVTSPNDPNYTYTWNPGALIGPTHTVSPATTTVYTVDAYDAVSGCGNTADVTVTVYPYPSPVTIVPASAQVPAGEIQQLSAVSGIILEEGFNEPTNTWTTINNSTGGIPEDAAWTLQPDGYYTDYSTFHSNDNTQFYMSDSDAQGMGGTTATILQSPAFSTVGYPAVTLDFYHFYKHYSGSTGKVEASLDGTSWTTLQTFSSSTGSSSLFVKVSVNLPAPFLGQPSVMVRFKYDGSWAYYWCVDNVKIYNPAPADITWSPATYLYLDDLATIPYAGEVTSLVYSKPLATTIYTATSTGAGGCAVSKNVTVSSCAETPADIVGQNPVSDGFELDWSSVQGAHANPLLYTIDIATDEFFTLPAPGSPFTVNDPVTSLTVSGLDANTVYYYRIKAASECESDYTGGSVTTCAGTPENLAVNNVLYTSFDLDWNTPAGGTASPITYTVDIALDALFDNPITGSPFILADPVTTLSVTGLTSATQYYYRVKATGVCDSEYADGDVTTTLCEAPSGFTAAGTSGTTGYLAWNAALVAPPDGYEYEVRLNSDNSLVASGTTDDLFAAITGLTTGTTYDAYLRAACDPTTFTNWLSASFTTTNCALTTIPYFEGFESYSPPNYGCLTVEDVNMDDITWRTINTPSVAHSGSKLITVTRSSVAGVPMNDWVFTEGLSLEEGRSYKVSFWYRARSSTSSMQEKLEVKFGGAPMASAMLSPAIFEDPDFNHATYLQGTATFTAPYTGAFWVGWHCYSAEFMAGIYLDDISICELPADAGAIEGTALVCRPQTGVSYTVPVIEDATDYVWSVPTGAVITSGEHTNSIMVDFPLESVSGDVTVYGVNSCGDGTGSSFTVDVYPQLPVSVSITSPVSTICEGDEVTYTAHPVNLGPNPLYQWKVNNIEVGTNTDTYAYYPLDGDQVICILTSDAICAISNPATSNTISMTVIPQLVVGSISADETICENHAPALLVSTPPSTGNTPDYQWQYSYDDIDYYDIIGATDNTYQPGNLSITTYYRQMQNALVTCSGPLPTNVITITVIPTVGLPTPITVDGGVEPTCQLTNGTTTTTYGTTSTNSTGFVWSLSDPMAGFINTSGMVTWNDDYYGTVDIQVIANGCNGPSAMVTRTVNIIPTVGTPTAITVSAGSEPVCQITPTTPATTYSTTASDNTGFNWSLSNPLAGSIDAAGIVTWTDGFSGSVDIQVTANGCNGPSAMVTRTVNITPTVGTPTAIVVSAGTEPGCQLTNGTTTTTYSTTATDNTGFTWSVSNPLAGTIDANGVMTWTDGFFGSVDIQVIALGCNGPSAMVTRPVTVYQNLPVSVTISTPQTTVCAGTLVTFTAVPVNGGANPTYQWKLNSSNVGTNSDTYAFTPFTGDLVTCELTSNATCATGNPATSNSETMTVNQNLPVSVSIVRDANSVCAGTTVNFTATPVNGGLTPSYQWYVNELPAGTDSPNFSYQPVNLDVVDCIMTSSETCTSGNPALSNALGMIVNPVLPVSVSIEASANSVCLGTSVTFTATAINGGAVPVYIWKVNDVIVPGASGSTYTYAPANNDEVKCELNSSIACVSGNPATSNTIVMDILTPQTVSITIAPSANPVCAGTQVTFTAYPVNGGSSPAFEWRVGTRRMGNNPTMTYTPVNNDAVTCRLTSNAYCVANPFVISAPYIMTVNPVVPVSVSIIASANNICDGTTVEYTATPTNGGANPTYQWMVNTFDVPGATDATYSYMPSDNDLVSCLMTSDLTCTTGNPATSNVIDMTVYPVYNLSVTIDADNEEVCEGTSVLFTAYPVDAGASPAYQWSVNGSEVIGATNATFSYVPSNLDAVICVVTSAEPCTNGNPATSNTVTITVNPYVEVSVYIEPNSNPSCVGSTVTFTAYPVNGGASPTYEWLLNESVVPGVSGSVYSFIPNEFDKVTCKMTSSLACTYSSVVTSDTVVMNIYPYLPASVTIDASATMVDEGTVVVFTATPVNGGYVPVYQWKKNGNVVAGVSGSTYSYVPADGDEVTCVMYSTYLCPTGSPATSNAIFMTVKPQNVEIGTVVVGPGEVLCYNAANTITIAGDGEVFTVENGASVTMIAGQKILYRPGTIVLAGGYMHGYISNDFCGAAPPPITANNVVTGSEGTPVINANASFRIYPNPTKGSFILEVTGNVLPENMRAELFSMQGERILVSQLPGQNRHEFNIADLPAGLYFVKIIAGETVETIKVIKTR